MTPVEFLQARLDDPHSGEKFKATRPRVLPSGRVYDIPSEVDAWPVQALVAYRCPDCYHDIVYVAAGCFDGMREGECWDLDESDYGTMGSTDISPVSTNPRRR